MPNTTDPIQCYAPAGTTMFLVATAKGRLANYKPRTVHHITRNAIYLTDNVGKMTFRPVENARITDDGNLEINTNTDRYALFTK